MKTRLATAKDSEEVAAIIKRHAQDDYMGYATFNDTYIKDKMKKNNFFFVAEDSDKIVGCIRASIVDLDLAEIRTLCVDEGYRKKGLATELLAARTPPGLRDSSQHMNNPCLLFHPSL